MRRSRRRRRPPGGNGLRSGRLAGCAVLLALMVVLVLFVHARIRPVVEHMAAYQVKVYAAKIVNNALIDELDRNEIAYGDIVKVSQRSDGSVTSIQSDMVAINRLKSEMARSIINELENHEQSVIKVPLGTLIGNEWVSGWGPKVEIRVLPSGYVQSEIYNQFNSAGINQTLHQVMLRVNVQMTAILPGYSITTETVTNFCVAETVIVGSIPEAFTNINGDDSPLISKINDYTADSK